MGRYAELVAQEKARFRERLAEPTYHPGDYIFYHMDESIMLMPNTMRSNGYVSPGRWALNGFFQKRLMHPVAFNEFDGWTMVLEFETGEVVEAKVEGNLIGFGSLPYASFTARFVENIPEQQEGVVT